MATEVRHDGFARQSLMREVTHKQNCYYCGTAGAKWRYGILPDDRLNGRIEWCPGAFCNISCWDSFQF